jgi:hypothetical protein
MVKAKPRFLARFPHARAWPSPKPFCDFCRIKLKARDKQNPRGQLAHEYVALKRGKPVRRVFAELFLAFLTERLRWESLTLDSCFDSIAAGGDGVEDQGWEDPTRIYDALTNQLRDGADELYAQNPLRDIADAARIVEDWLGRTVAKPGEWLVGVTPGLHPRSSMGWTSRDHYERWLLSLLDAQYRSLMFPVVRVGGDGTEEWRRVGVSVMVPLSESAFLRMVAGELNDQDLTAKELQSPTRYIYIHAMIDDDRLPPGVTALQRAAAEAQCFMYQLAYFTRGIKPFNPVLVTIVTCRLFEERLRRQHFREVGKCLRGTKARIVQFPLRTAKGKLHLSDLPAYELWRLGLRVIQKVNAPIWRREEKVQP